MFVMLQRVKEHKTQNRVIDVQLSYANFVCSAPCSLPTNLICPKVRHLGSGRWTHPILDSGPLSLSLQMRHLQPFTLPKLDKLELQSNNCPKIANWQSQGGQTTPRLVEQIPTHRTHILLLKVWWLCRKCYNISVTTRWISSATLKFVLRCCWGLWPVSP